MVRASRSVWLRVRGHASRQLALRIGLLKAVGGLHLEPMGWFALGVAMKFVTVRQIEHESWV